MKSFEELMRMNESDLILETNFKDFLIQVGDIERKTIEYMVYVDSLDDLKRQRLNSFMGDYAGNKNEDLERLYEKHELTVEDRNDVKPIMELANKYNTMVHVVEELPFDCGIIVEKEILKVNNEYLKSNKSKLSKELYRYLRTRIK